MSVSSMTGYSVVSAPTRLGILTLECRSVNSRFLDLNFRLPDDVRSFEPMMRERLQKGLQRGKVDIKASLKTEAQKTLNSLNPEGLKKVLDLQAQIMTIAPDAKPLNVSQLLGMEGVLNFPDIDQEALNQEVGALVDTLIQNLKEARAREGAALKSVLLGHAQTIDNEVKALESYIPHIISHLESKLEERLDNALMKRLTEHSTLTQEEVQDRIRQEVTLYAIRMDVEEEMSRLLTHTRELRRLLDKGGAIGRRLDFLVQEMNREANTLGSKASAIEMTNTALNLKVAIEQIREQIQNIE